MKAECPKNWYTEGVIREWLKREGMPHERDLPAFLAKHFQLALEKGWQLRESDCRAHANEALERAAKVAEDMPGEILEREQGKEIAAAIRALKE